MYLNIVLGVIVLVDTGFYGHGIFPNVATRGVVNLTLRQSLSRQRVLVHELGLRQTTASIASKLTILQRAILGCELLVTRVDEAEALDGELCATALTDQTRLNINHECIVEAVRDLIVGEVLAIHRQFDRQDVRLGVLGDVDLDLC